MISRRDFLVTSGIAVLGRQPKPPPKPLKTRVALVGTGIRGVSLWGKELRKNYDDVVEFVGLCDINPGRLEFAKGYIGVDCPTFSNFDGMLEATKPDRVIVTTVDSTHHELMIRAMDAGIDVITEKPMTTDEAKCQAIIDAQKRSGSSVVVTHNYRYAPHRERMKKLLTEGRIGRVTSVDFHWYLDIYHGASYFRRWHGKERFSGTLLRAQGVSPFRFTELVDRLRPRARLCPGCPRALRTQSRFSFEPMPWMPAP